MSTLQKFCLRHNFMHLKFNASFYFFNYVILSFCCFAISVEDQKATIQQYKQIISLAKSKVYGPGLEVNFTVPVRYFFMQLIDTEGGNFTTGSQSLAVQVIGLKQKCRIWSQVLDTSFGSYIVRYRLYEVCQGLKIDITYGEEPIAASPYILEGMLYHEHCYCPVSLPQWLTSLSCPSAYKQMDKDLSIYSNIDMGKVLQDALKRFDRPGAYSICHYVVVENKVHRKCYGQYVGFSMFMDEILLSLARKVHLPDIEMLVNLGDWPLEQRLKSQNPIPIFSWCGSEDTRDIVMPTYDITEATLEMMGRVMLDIISVMGNSKPNWELKEKQAFWRGRDSRQERLNLIKLARKYPDMINASLTNFFFYRKEEAEYGPKADYISFFDFFKYRYQINIDGTVAAYRMPYLLGGRSLVLKQESNFYEHFYSELKPMVHYVPFKRDLSDLIEQLQWAMTHDEEAKQIAENARQFALNNLLPKDVLCYYAMLFKEYAKLLKTKPQILEDMDLVDQPSGKACNCENQREGKEERDEL